MTHAMELCVSYKRQVSLSRKSVKRGLTGNMMCLCNTVLHYRCHVVKVVVMTQCYINSVNIFLVNPSSTALRMDVITVEGNAGRNTGRWVQYAAGDGPGTCGLGVEEWHTI